MSSTDTVYLDLETTGLGALDEIVEIGILSDNGQVLLDTLVKPINHLTWVEAESVHGISPDDVKNAPILDEIRPLIAELVKSKTVVIYNANFDSNFLGNELKLAKEIKCCMLAFSPVYGEWHDYWGNYTWQSLDTAADYVCHVWKGDQHSAIADCYATRCVWQYLTNDTEKKRVDDLKKRKKEAQEIAYEVQKFLDHLKYAELRKQELFLADMNNFWMKQLFGRETETIVSIGGVFSFVNLDERFFSSWQFWGKFYEVRMHTPIKGDEQQRREEQEEKYYKIFTGYSKKVWKQLRLCDGLACYRLKKEIPKGLVALSKIEAPDWILSRMSEKAYYLSKSGKSFHFLYDVSDIEKIRETKPNRYECFNAVPEGIKSKTRLKKEHGVDVNKQNLKPVGDYRLYTPYGVKYIPLYNIPNFMHKSNEMPGSDRC